MNPNQILFNKAYLGLKAQGFRQSMNADQDECAYRGSGGLKCAIGHCIPDEHYDPEIEGLPVLDTPVEDLLITLYPGIDPHFASSLQGIHDQTSKTVMKSRLEEFARFHRLEVPNV